MIIIDSTISIFIQEEVISATGDGSDIPSKKIMLKIPTKKK